MFDFKKYNDYELLYLYNIHSEEALRILLKKYSCLIDIKLCAFRVRNYQFADFRQECLLSLMYAINNTKKYSPPGEHSRWLMYFSPALSGILY